MYIGSRYVPDKRPARAANRAAKAPLDRYEADL